MKPQLIFGILTIATGLLGGSFTHPAIALAKRGALSAQRCCVCVRPWRCRRLALASLVYDTLRERASAQIAHSIPPQQTSPILIATAYTDLTLPTLRQGDRGRDVQLLQRILQDNGFLGAAGVRLGNPRGAIVDGTFGAATASAVRDLQRRLQNPSYRASQSNHLGSPGYARKPLSIPASLETTEHYTT
ncbi:peptidoglycan-binding protein [Nostoc sp. KVJ20]|uniref:peptidoglycan-binding domain-containing protein n=1 Tax=Nostoc sp. KVJ20 TaxID=457944 RepID=UPI000A660CDB|nr:peptidoglycan-binding domain-containing protein [Nostoc sp. KVJ20]